MAAPRSAFGASPSRGGHQWPGKAGSAVTHVLVVLCVALGLSACGFELRHAPHFAFSTIYIGSAPASALGNELKRSVATSDGVTVVPSLAGNPQVIMDVLGEQREKAVVGLNASGQVREFELRLRFKFKLRTPQGKELIPETELLQQRDISYNETAALSKETEENLLYRDMQTDLVQQLMRRLAAVKTL
jgi:LPS-assembly lipoprotein